MFKSLSTLRRSEFQALSDRLGTNHGQLEFGAMVARFLDSHPLDGGADQDIVYVTGLRIAEAGLWEKVNPITLARSIERKQHEAAEILLKTAPAEIASKILEKALELHSDRPATGKRHRVRKQVTSRKQSSSFLGKDYRMAKKKALPSLIGLSIGSGRLGTVKRLLESTDLTPPNKARSAIKKQK